MNGPPNGQDNLLNGQDNPIDRWRIYCSGRREWKNVGGIEICCGNAGAVIVVGPRDSSLRSDSRYTDIKIPCTENISEFYLVLLEQNNHGPGILI